ncbi:MAG: protein kinase [Polyangiales bacterium]
MRSTTSAPLATASEFLRADEINRIRTMSIGLLVACGAGAGMLALLPGDPIATRWAMLGLGLLVLAFGGLVWVARDVRTFDPNAVGVLSLVNAVASAMMAFYFGVFSPFPSLVALVLFTYSLGAPLRWASVVWAVAAGAQLTLGLLVSFEVVPDRGLVRPENLDLTTKLVAQAAIQLVYGVSFVVGHAIGRRTRVAADALESAVRQVAARDALLREARAELERAAGLGSSGRFTGQRLGSFELGVIIGRGGMGEIYGAVHVESGEEAAVKLLQRGAGSFDGDPIARFEREARIVAALDSPHVVRVLEIGGAEAPLPYLAMVLLRGRDLAWHLRERRKLPPKQVAELRTPRRVGAREGVERRIVHRDLKPQNPLRGPRAARCGRCSTSASPSSRARAAPQRGAPRRNAGGHGAGAGAWDRASTTAPTCTRSRRSRTARSPAGPPLLPRRSQLCQRGRRFAAAASGRARLGAGSGRRRAPHRPRKVARGPLRHRGGASPSVRRRAPWRARSEGRVPCAHARSRARLGRLDALTEADVRARSTPSSLRDLAHEERPRFPVAFVPHDRFVQSAASASFAARASAFAFARSCSILRRLRLSSRISFIVARLSVLARSSTRWSKFSCTRPRS